MAYRGGDPCVRRGRGGVGVLDKVAEGSVRVGERSQGPRPRRISRPEKEGEERGPP
jgi:hypothetical protein